MRTSLSPTLRNALSGGGQIEYLGHIVTADGVAADPTKLEAMRNWPRPHNVLGLTGYYCRFVAQYDTIAFPLTQVLKKDGFHWQDEVTVAFDRLKQAMLTVPILRLPDFTQPFVIESDASGVGVGLNAKSAPTCVFQSGLATISPS